MNHLAGIALLPEFAVHAEFDGKVVRITDFIFRHDPRTTWRESVEPFSGQPVKKLVTFALATIGNLFVQPAFRDVVEDGITENMIISLARRDVPATLANDDGEFDFPADTRIAFADHDVVAVADNRGEFGGCISSGISTRAAIAGRMNRGGPATINAVASQPVLRASRSSRTQ